MRITNNVIMRNTKTNINGNKINVNDKNNQMSSQKKIDRPSDDPVIAVRALRLRSNLSELKQYLKTNIEEADSWMEITDTALLNIKNLLNDMHTLADHGANDTLNQDDRNTILAQLRQNQEQIYSEGNADYAGRTVFTGWKTDTTLTFPRDTSDYYQIDQRLSFEDLSENRYVYNEVSDGDIANIAGVTYSAAEDPGCETLQRIRLAYDHLACTPADPSATPPVPASGVVPKVSLVDRTTGEVLDIELTPFVTTTKKLEENSYDLKSIAGTLYPDDASKDPYAEDVGKRPVGNVTVNVDTGEILLTKEQAEFFKKNQMELQVTYDKQGFEKGDLTPENYFNCRKFGDKGSGLEVDKTFTHIREDGTWIEENINYTVATNQEMAINIEARKVFDQNLIRDMKDLEDTVQASIDAYDKVSKLEGMMKMDVYADEESQSRLSALLERANKEASYADDIMKKTYAHYVGVFQGYIDTAELARTDLGSRGQRLALTKNRVESQYNTVDKLKAENEDEDLSDIVIDYQAAYLAYQASLQAASKVQQQTLLDYI